jgi:glycosyltransferase involved in cell wall biosynthesis
LLSIIVPVYNIHEYLPKCIESIIHQKYDDFECILVDDGSIDGSGEICDKYASICEKIKVIHKENGGLVSARKAGIKKSIGEYIAFVDGDDWIEPDIYSSMISYLKQYDCEVAVSGYYNDDENFRRECYHNLLAGYYDKERIRKVRYSIINNGEFFEWGIFPSLWDAVFKRNIIKNILLVEDEKICIGEDAAIMFYILLNADSFFILDKCLYHYRQRYGSLTTSNYDRDKIRHQMITLYNFTKKYIGSDKILQSQWKEFMLFHMFQRADQLYEGINDLPYLFPFPKVRYGSDIIIYGAGFYGKNMYFYLTDSGFCNVEGWYDRDFKNLQNKGYDVKNPIDMDNNTCKIVIIAIAIAHVRKSVYSELVSKFPEKNIYMIDVDEILSDKSIKAFGLI